MHLLERKSTLRSVKSMPNLYELLSPGPVESNGVFTFLLYTEQAGDVLQLILSQSCCTFVCIQTLKSQHRTRGGRVWRTI